MRGAEDYLSQIKRLEEDGHRCTATVLAQTLGVSLPSASEMLKRLGKEGYLQRGTDGTISLTAEGRPLAHKTLRRHRLVERLLTDILGMPWYEAHQEAHRIEHAISSRVEEHLFQSLRFPEYCPHGHPICPFDRRTLRKLDSVQVGEEFGIAQISEIKEELLAYFDQIGIRPGSIVKLLERGPHEGPLTLATDAGTISLGMEVAAYIQVCKVEEADWISRRSNEPL
ncbi:MAG: metal-dependent transcriptional regulator [Actinomycetota bacterium]